MSQQKPPQPVQGWAVLSVSITFWRSSTAMKFGPQSAANEERLWRWRESTQRKAKSELGATVPHMAISLRWTKRNGC